MARQRKSLNFKFKELVGKRLLLMGTIVFFFIAPASIAEKKVIAIHSYPPGEWTNGINSGYVETLGKLGEVVSYKTEIFHSEYWLNKPIEEQKEEKKRLLKIIHRHKPDLIILNDDEVADFLAPELISEDQKIILAGINREPQDLVWLSPTHKAKIYTILEHIPVTESLRLLKSLSPSIRKISILSSANSTSLIVASFFKKHIESDEFAKKNKISIRKTYLHRKWSDWKNAINEIKTKDSALFVLVPYDVRDQNNQEVSIERIGKWLTSQLKIPTLGILSVHTKIGLLSGVNISGFSIGRQAAEISAQIFSGKPQQQFFFKAKYFDLEINADEAKRLKLRISHDLLNSAKIVHTQKLLYGR